MQKRASLFLGLVLIVMATPSVYAETSIYKCSKPDGSVVFSPTPCGKGAREVGVPKPSSVSQAPAADAVRDISDTVADTRCREDAAKLYVAPDTSAITRAEADIRAAEQRYWVGNTAQAQQMASDDATRVVGLRNLIATERVRVDSQRAESQKRVDAALAQCTEQKRRRSELRGK
jgi:hypothetical protein